MALQFKIQICEITKPPVWRRVIVPETFTFERFHYVIQAVFGWDNSHLYEFSEWQYEDKHSRGYIDIFRISSFSQYPIKLRLGLLSSSLLTEEYPLAEKYLTQINDNEWILDTSVCGYEGVGRFVLGLYNDIEIIESEKFREYIRKNIEKYKQKTSVS